MLKRILSSPSGQLVRFVVGLITALTLLALHADRVHALPMAYTDHAAFLAAAASLPGATTVVDFESGSSGDLIADGGTFAGISFDYPTLAGLGVSLAITDGSEFGGGGPFDALSGSLFLGTDDADLLQAGDDLELSFASVGAIGLFILSADTPGVDILDDDLELTAGGITALLDVDTVFTTLSDGTNVYFLGVIDDTASFTTASLTTAAGVPSGSFLFNVEDIVTVVPEPHTAALLALGLVGLALTGRRRGSRARHGHPNGLTRGVGSKCP